MQQLIEREASASIGTAQAIIGRRQNVDGAASFADFLDVRRSTARRRGSWRRAVLISADAPAPAALFRARGLEVVTVPVSEFEKLEGRHVPVGAHPAGHSFSVHPGRVEGSGPEGRAPARGSAASTLTFAAEL